MTVKPRPSNPAKKLELPGRVVRQSRKFGPKRARDDRTLAPFARQPQVFGARIGQRLQEHAVHDAENGGVAPMPMARVSTATAVNPRFFEEHAGRKPNPAASFQETEARGGRGSFFGLLAAAEFHKTPRAVLRGAHARAQIVFDVQLEMALQLRREFAVAAFR